MKALQEALAQAEARAKQEAEQRTRMEAEIKAHQEAERKAREEAEARAKAAEEAVAQALKKAEEAARAKADAEARADQATLGGAAGGGGGDAAAQERMQAAMRALDEAKAKARSEGEARVEAERKAKVEAETRQREEIERQAREERERKAREEADAKAKLQMKELQDQANRARQEADARSEIERKAREEAEARFAAERKAREESEVQAALERKSRDEALAKARVEAEAKARAEVESMIAAERKAREVAEKKAQSEIAAMVEAEKKSRAEAQRQTEIAKKAHADAEAKSRELANSGNAQAAMKARAEAEAAARKAEEAVAQANARADMEKKARAEAEERAKAESVARVMQEQQLRSKSEDEIKARVQEEIKARELAEMEADARYRQEAAARAKASAEERRKREEEARAAGGAAPRVKSSSTNWATMAVIGVVVVIGGAVGLLEVVPLNNFIGGAQDILSKRLGAPVTITGLRYRLASGPGLTLERVAIGKLQEIKIDSIAISGLPMAFLGDSKSFDNVEVVGISADQDNLALVAGWIKPPDGGPSVRVRRLKLTAVKLTTRGIEIPIFNGDISMGTDGGLERAVLTDGKLKLDIAPKDKGVRVGMEAHGWKLPLGPGLEFEDLALEVVFEPQQATITGIDGKIGFSPVKGSAKASWDASGIRVDGDFTVANGELPKLMAIFTRDFNVTGQLAANGTYTIQGPTLEKLFTESKVDATFNIEKGTLSNVDIVRAIQSPARDGVRGGRTGFNSLTGSLQFAGKNYSYRQLQLASGPMQASGNVDIAANGDLSGRVSAELGTKTMVVAKGTLNVTGNLKTPVLKQ